MLTTTWTLGQTIRISEAVSITVLGISGDEVRLGIIVPGTVRVRSREKNGEQPAERDAKR